MLGRFLNREEIPSLTNKWVDSTFLRRKIIRTRYYFAAQANPGQNPLDFFA